MTRNLKIMKMKRIIQITLFAAIFTFLGVQDAVAQKVGHVNAQSIVYELPEMKQATSNLEALAGQYKKQLQTSKEKLEAKLMEATIKQERGELSPSDIQRIQQELGGEEQALFKKEQEYQQQLLKKEEELTGPLYEKIKTAINDVAKENGYSYILDATAVLFAEEVNDITSKVKAKLGM